MLGKLLKYEFKSTGRILPLIYLAVIVLSLCAGLSLRVNMFADDMAISNILLFTIYIILVVALIVVTIIVIISRFYKSMISQEAYLMHTLPVKPWQHIMSKAIMAVIWTAIAVVVILVSLMLIGGASGLWGEIVRGEDFQIFWADVKYMVSDFMIMMIIICSIVQGIRYILQVYAAIAIGGSSTKNKVAYSFLAFIVLAIITSVIASIISSCVALGSMDWMELLAYTGADMGFDMTGFMNGLFIMQLIMDGAFTVVFFFLTNYFLKNKLNLE